jgi:SAM-dependent methyltransferase
MDLATYREQSLETWEGMASTWQERRDWLIQLTGHINDRIVERVDPQPGQTYLDLAAGLGDLSFAVAERVGDDGRVLCTDFAAEMVEQARRNGEEKGLSNVDYRQVDAERMDLDDDSVDGVTCRFGYMLMADPGAALKETKRVLRDGGPLGFAVWATPDRNPWAAVPAITLVQRGHFPPPEPGAPGIFAMGDVDGTRAQATDAGFADVDLEEAAFDFHYSDADDVWDSLIKLAGPLARAVSALPEDEREATRAAIMDNMAGFRHDDGSYSAPAMAWVGLAR